LGYCSFITDSANSATAIMTGHKSTVNALGVYRESTPNPFDDPKVETIAERESELSRDEVSSD
jgi:alkaline phosphatase